MKWRAYGSTNWKSTVPARVKVKFPVRVGLDPGDARRAQAPLRTWNSRPEGQPETRYHNKPMYILQVRVKVVSLRKVSLLALQPLPLLLPAVLLPRLQLL